jgi:hypothetical protein
MRFLLKRWTILLLMRLSAAIRRHPELINLSGFTPNMEHMRFVSGRIGMVDS